MVTINKLKNLIINKPSKFYLEILIPLLEKEKSKIEIAKCVLPVVKVEKKKIIKKYVCKNCGFELKRKPRVGTKKRCPKCGKPFYIYPLGRRSRKKGKKPKENFEEKTQEITKYQDRIEKNVKIGWYRNSKQAFDILISNKLIHKRKEKYDINFSLLSKLFLNSIKDFCDSKCVERLESFSQNFSKLLKLNRNSIFNYDRWKFLFTKNNKFYSPFNSIFGFLNFVFLSLIIAKEYKRLWMQESRFTVDEFYFKLTNIVSIWKVVSDIVEEMYAKMPIWELERDVIVKGGKLIPIKQIIIKEGKKIAIGEDGKEYNYEQIGKRYGYHLVSEKLDEISNIEIDDNLLSLLKEIYSYIFNEVKDKSPNGLEEFLKNGIKLSSAKEYIPFNEFWQINFDRKIERLLKI